MNPNFLQLYGNRTLENLTADWKEVVLDHESDVWLNLPPQDFLDFVVQYPPTPFDSVPAAQGHLKPPTYLISQAHRMWITASNLDRQLKAIGAKNFIDLGSFPFFVPLLMRDYFHFNGDIYASTNLSLPEAGRDFLKAKNIEVFGLDLDPYVSDPRQREEQILPTEMPFEDGSIDLILQSHVIEHLYHPRSVVKECFRLLRSGGQIVITTDNAMMVEVFTNFIGGYGYVFEPIENTAAMTFTFWRGHVRFFTERDLASLLKAEGFFVRDVEFSHCFYDILFKEYFAGSDALLSGWKRTLLAETPWLRNDISIVGEKGKLDI